MPQQPQQPPQPPPPSGYHYLGQPASIFEDANGIKKSTQLLLVDNRGTQKDRYSSYYAQVGNSGQCFCAFGCKKPFTKFKNDMKGVMNHLRTYHNNLLHPDDRKEESAKNQEEGTDNTATAGAGAAAADDDDDDDDDLSFLNAVGTLTGQLTLQQSFSGAKKRAVTAAITCIKRSISNNMADLIMHRGFPFTLVQDKHMQQYTRATMRMVNPSIKPEYVHFHSTNTMATIVDKKLSNEEATMLGDLKQDIQSMKVPIISFANDCTTSVADVSYCATCVYIIVDSSGVWEMKEYALDYSEFTIPHTRARAFEQAHDTIRKSMPYLSHKPLSEIILAGIFDCAANTPAVIFKRNGVQHNVKCVGHRLSTATKHVVDRCAPLQAAIDCIENVMKTIKKSKNNKELVKKVMRGQNLRGLVPKNPHDIRWQSKTTMLKRAKELQVHVTKIKDEKDDYGNSLHWHEMKFTDNAAMATFEANVDDWNITYRNTIAFCFPFMEKLKYWTTMLEAGTKVTISLVNYAIADITVVCEKLEDKIRSKFRGPAGEGTRTDLLSTLSSMKEVMNEVFAKDDFALNELMVIARILDPRVAMEPGGQDKLLLPQLKDDDGDTMNVVDVMLKFYRTSPLCESLFAADEKWEPLEERLVGKNRNAAHPMLAGISTFREQSNFVDNLVKFKNEVTGYLTLLASMAPNKKDAQGRTIENEFDYFPLLIDPAMDPLVFWSNHKAAYPRLYEIAKVVLAAPAMAAGTERMHSSSKRVFGVDRASLGSLLGGRLSLSYHRFRQGNGSKADKRKWYPFGHIITLDDEDDEDDPEDDPDPDVEFVPTGDEGYDSYYDEEEIYPDVVGPADAEVDVDVDVDADADADADDTSAAGVEGDNGVADGADRAEESDGLYRYTIKDIVFFPEDHEVIPPTAAEVAAAAAKTTRSGRSIKRRLHHDELYDNSRSTKRVK